MGFLRQKTSPYWNVYAFHIHFSDYYLCQVILHRRFRKPNFIRRDALRRHNLPRRLRHDPNGQRRPEQVLRSHLELQRRHLQLRLRNQYYYSAIAGAIQYH